ncbi:hypothetical protein ACF052_05295 [Streptomyces pilosus]|uniref:hypothetical protein n=1 Tax=Streptomyces pilosus TaxID=28893 RepID=UPI0036F987D0
MYASDLGGLIVGAEDRKAQGVLGSYGRTSTTSSSSPGTTQKAKASRGEDADVHDLPTITKKAAKKTTARKTTAPGLLGDP